MRDLIKTIPDVNALLALEPEELGAKLIFLIARRERDGRFHPNSYQIELELAVPPDAHYPPAQVPQAQLAISEAFAWLELRRLLCRSRVTTIRTAGDCSAAEHAALKLN
jgi:hypothetical protein